MGTIQLIPWKNINYGENEVRYYNDDNSESILEMRESFNEYGQFNPVTVKKIEEDQFQLLAGHTRLFATMESYKQLHEGVAFNGNKIENLQDRHEGWTKILVNIIEPTVDDFEIALEENLARKNLHPLEEAIAYQKLKNLHEAKYPQTKQGGALGGQIKAIKNNPTSTQNAEADEVMGFVKLMMKKRNKSETWIRNILLLNDLPESDKESYRKNTDAKLSTFVNLARKYKAKPKEDDKDKNETKQDHSPTEQDIAADINKNEFNSNNEIIIPNEDEQSREEKTFPIRQENDSQENSTSNLNSSGKDENLKEPTSEIKSSSDGENISSSEPNEETIIIDKNNFVKEAINETHIQILEIFTMRLEKIKNEINKISVTAQSQEESFSIGENGWIQMQDSAKNLNSSLINLLKIIKKKIQNFEEGRSPNIQLTLEEEYNRLQEETDFWS